MNDIEHGAKIFLFFRGETDQYLSLVMNEDSMHGVGMGATTRRNMLAWETFVVWKHDDRKISLQNISGGFLSPATLDGNSWTFRPWCRAWEHFEIEAIANTDGLTTDSVAIRLAGQIPAKYLAPPRRKSGKCTIQTAGEPPRWNLRLAEIPQICLYGTELNWIHQQFSEADALHRLPPKLQHLVHKLYRAHREFGAFLLIGHGLPSDLLPALEHFFGSLPWRDDAGAADGDLKRNETICEERHQSVAVNVPLLSGFARLAAGEKPALLDAVRVDFHARRALSEAILHALALAQQHVQGATPAWRERFHDPERYLGLRALVYHPGPPARAGGDPVWTTARHTDATWITLLQASGPGLEILRPGGEDGWCRLPDRPAAAVANTGNVLARESGGFYPAVCHRVVRLAGAGTRVSLPFFYDRNGGATGGC